MKLRVKYLEGAKRMEKINKGNWIDCYAYEDVFIPEGERGMVSLGFALELPKGWEGHLAPRSSTFKTWGVIQTNSVGVVDDTYIGDGDVWHMPVYCLQGKETDMTIAEVNDTLVIKNTLTGEEINLQGASSSEIEIRKGTWIRKGDKIAQFRIMEVMPEIEFEEVEVLGNENRGGFGTTSSR